MPTYTLVIPKKPVSWNAVKHDPWKYSKMANEWKEITYYMILKAKLPKIIKPVTIVFTARWKQKRKHDIDSLYCKAVVDQLVTSGVLIDDNLNQLTSVTFRGEVGAEKDELVITITC